MIDFVPIFFIFNLFQRNFRGSFRFKKIPSSKKSQVDFRGGGQPISIKSQVQKSPNPARGAGVITTWDQFPSFVAFSIGKLPLDKVINTVKQKTKYNQ